ncbi:hypothetical protein [Streptomyces sp. RFCAC02]|uniref:hypothetical protein n=1 Tax=Streptomyces sp. RFCAC02 TaxID=2499143 RepID=UPI00101EEDB1|nr:hypothetical protein [Streptomyces sp. RFCAC02]
MDAQDEPTTPPGQQPARQEPPDHPPGHRLSAVAAALLNATGTGAGYFYAGIPAFGVLALITSGLLVIVANAVNASDTPGFWVPLYALWLVFLARGGWKWTQDRRLKKPRRVLEPRRPWIAAVTGAVVLGLATTGLVLFRGTPADAFAAGQAAHADGDCAAALPHYADAMRVRYEFTLTPAAGDARAEVARCADLTAAREREEAGELVDAIDGYQTYLDGYGGGDPVWRDADDHLAGLRLDHADGLAEAALAAEGEGPDRYLPTINAYAALAEKQPDTEQAALVPDRIEALWTGGTPALAAEDHCAAVGQLAPFAALSGEDDRAEARDLAERADAALPGAYFGCGETRRADHAYCDAIGSYTDAVAAAGDDADLAGRAEAALNHSRYDCGRARADDGDACAAIDVFDEVAGDYADRAADAKRDALYGCAEEAFDDADWERAREMAQQVADDGGSRADDAEDLLIAIEIAEIDAGGSAGTLPPPSEAGSAPGGTSQVQIINGSAEELEILYTGPETGRVTVDAGGGGGQFACTYADGLPSRTLSLPPGDYTVVARAVSDGSVTPYSGGWDLTSGTLYSDCYYIETSWGYGY